MPTLKMSHHAVLPFLLLSSVACGNEELKMTELIDLPIEEVIKVRVPSRTDKDIATAPSSVTVFTARQIKQMGVRTVGELLNFVPGFQATRMSRLNQGYMVSARGLTTPQSSYNILFMIDGHRLNDVSSGGVGAANHYLTTANIKQIEVIRGPGSALYGTGAFSGIVNIITKDKPEKNKEHQLHYSMGNRDSHEFHGQVSRQEKDWGISLFGQYYDDNGQTYDHPAKPAPDVIEKDQEVYAKFRWQDLRVNFRYSEEEFTGFLGERKTENLQQESVRVEYDLLNDDDWKLTLHGSFQHQRLASFDAENRRLFTIEDDEFNVGFNGSYQLNEDHLLLAGVEWRYATVNSNVVKKSKRDVLGIYLQDQYQITDDLELTLGVRYDTYSDDGENLNPRAALIYTTDFDATFKLMYGQAFRAPSIRQTSQERGLGNPNLKPEEIRTLEFAWLQSFSKRFQTSVTYFHSWSENKINTVFRENPPPGELTRRFANLDGTMETSGIEVEMQAQLTDEFFLRGSYTHLLDTEENPRRAAKNTASLIANYQYQNLNINVNGHYHDTMEQETLSGALVLDDYWLLNTNVRYKVSDWFTLVGRAQNLLDEEYASSTKLPGVPDGIPNRSRTWSIGFEVAF